MTPELQAQVDELSTRLWPVEAVMERLSVGRSTVFDLLGSGALRSIKIGRRRLVSEQSLRDFIASADGRGAA